MCTAWHLLSRKVVCLLKLEILENGQQFLVNMQLFSFEYCYIAFSLIKPEYFPYLSYRYVSCLLASRFMFLTLENRLTGIYLAFAGAFVKSLETKEAMFLFFPFV